MPGTLLDFGDHCSSYEACILVEACWILSTLCLPCPDPLSGNSVCHGRPIFADPSMSSLIRVGVGQWAPSRRLGGSKSQIWMSIPWRPLRWATVPPDGLSCKLFLFRPVSGSCSLPLPHSGLEMATFPDVATRTIITCCFPLPTYIFVNDPFINFLFTISFEWDVSFWNLIDVRN